MHGLRVLDLSRGIAGEFCARLLCGYGAEVIKIEHPQHPSATRGIPPFLRDEPGLDRSALFWHLNGGKQGITLDLSSAAGRHAAMGLAAIADVVIEDLTPGALDDMGLGYASLRRARPDIILTSVTPFGQSGPMRGHEATELGLLAAGGELYITGAPDREPIKPGAYLASHAGGLQAVVATSAALCLRQVTGMGRHIDVSVQEAVGMFLSGGPAWVHHFGQTQTRVAARVAQAMVRHAYSGNILQCSDGYLWFGTGHNQDMIGLLVGREDLASPELWRQPGLHADEIDAAIEAWTISRTRQEVTALAQELNIAVAPVLTLQEVLENPQHAAREFFQSARHPAFGDLLALGAPVRCNELTWQVGPAPALGEHNAQIFHQLLGGSPANANPSSQGKGDAPPTAPPKSIQPLERLRVLDLTNNVAGPFGTLALASLGAEVIKVERPWISELREGRRITPPAKPGAPDESYNRVLWFNEVNRGKRSVPIDLSSDQGRRLLLDLASVSDVIVSNFSTRVMNNLALDYETLVKVRPDIIYATVSGYGSTGPAASWSAAGPAIDAASGIAWLTGYPDGPPLRPGNFVPDPIAGLYLAWAVLMAVYRRRESGKGERIDLSMLEGMEHIVGGELVAAASGAAVPAKTGNDIEGMAPHGCFPCAGDDAWTVIAVENDRQWLSLCDVMGRPSWGRDERWRHAQARWEQRESLHWLLADWTASQDRFDLADRLQAAGVPAVAVLNSADLLRSPHLWERGYFEFDQHPHVPPSPFAGFGWGPFTSEPQQPAPLFSQHLDDVVELLGISAQQVEQLLAGSVIVRGPRHE